MFLVEDRYCKINVHLFCSLVYLPYQNTVLRVFLLLFCGSIFIMFTISQITDIVLKGLDIRRALVIVPTLVTMVACFGIIIILRLHKQRYEALFLLTVQDFPVENVEEYLIRERYTDLTKRIIKFTTLYMCAAVVGVFMVPFGSPFLDILLPLNETRPRTFVLLGEYFVNEEKYFYLITCMQGAAGFSVVLVAGVTINMAIIICRHFCALLAIIGYRMENLVSADNFNGYKVDNEKLILQKIEFCIESHLKVLEMISTYNDCNNWLLSLCLVATMISLIPTLAEVTDLELVETRSVLFASSQVGQFCLLSLLGQQMIDTSMTLPEKVYSSRWYNCPVNAQKLILFIIIKAQEPCTVHTNGVYVLSVKNFGAVLHAAMSYCMVLHQLR